MSIFLPRSRELTFEAALRDLTSTDLEVRAIAAGALGTVGPESRDQATEALRGALKDARGRVRYAAALSLGELDDISATPLLIDQLDDGDPQARQAAVIALGMVRATAAFDELEKRLGSGSPEVRYQAASALVAIDPSRAMGPLTKAAADSDPEVREAVATALSSMENRAAIAPLRLLANDARLGTRLEAAVGLSNFRDPAAAPTLIELVGQIADDANPRIFEALFDLADQIADPAPLRDICVKQLARFFGPPTAKVWAAAVLSLLGDARGDAALVKLAKHRREDVRGSCDEARAKINRARFRPTQSPEPDADTQGSKEQP